MMKPVPRKGRKGGGKGGGDDGSVGGVGSGGGTRSVAEASSTSKGMFYKLFVSYVFALQYTCFVCILLKCFDFSQKMLRCVNIFIPESYRKEIKRIHTKAR